MHFSLTITDSGEQIDGTPDHGDRPIPHWHSNFGGQGGCPRDATRSCFKHNDRLKGVLNLRGAVVPVLAMRTLLGYPERDILGSDQFVVILNGRVILAVHVDRAVDIVDFPNATTGEPESASCRLFAHETFGVVHCHSVSQLATQASLN